MIFEFDQIYNILMEEYMNDVLDRDSNRIKVGSRAEENFYKHVSSIDKFKIKKSTDIEDKTERWDFKIYENINGKFLPAFPNLSLNVQLPTIPKLRGTVDVKSAPLRERFTPIYLVSEGRGTAWCRGVNWISVPEGSGFRLIHCNSLMFLLKKYAGIVVTNPEETNAKIISERGTPLKFVDNYNGVDIEKGILYENPTTFNKGVVVKTNTLKAISIFI